MNTYTLKISLDANEETIVKRLALQDKMSIEEELETLLKLQIREESEFRDAEEGLI